MDFHLWYLHDDPHYYGMEMWSNPKDCMMYHVVVVAAAVADAVDDDDDDTIYKDFLSF